MTLILIWVMMMLVDVGNGVVECCLFFTLMEFGTGTLIAYLLLLLVVVMVRFMTLMIICMFVMMNNTIDYIYLQCRVVLFIFLEREMGFAV